MPEMNLPTHWKTARLEEVTDIFKGGTPKRSVEKYFQGNIAWAIPTDITALDSALYIDDTDTHISEEALGKSAARLLPTGTVLLTSRATIGETAITTVPMATNQGFANFICRDTLLNVYLAYYLRYIKRRLMDLAHGSTFKEITKGTLLNVEIPLPPLPEQRAIAHVLQTIQESKAARGRELTLERERKAALMDHLFSYGTKAEPRKQTEIGEIPESWEVVRLAELCSKITDGTHRTPTYVNAGVPFLRVVDIQSTKIDWENVKWIPKHEHEELIKRCKPEKGDVLLSKNGTIGKTKVVDWEEEFSIFVSLCLLKVKHESLNNVYLAEFLTSNGLPQIQKRGKKMTVTNLHLVEIRELLIPLPPVPEQQKIAETLRIFDTKIAALEQETARLDELFHAMLDELMTGQRSAVPLIDVESVQSA